MKYIIPVLLLLAACSTVTITNFEECAAAGNPVMESHPRQCAANGQTFVEVITNPPQTGDVQTLSVGPQLRDCTGVGPQKCMVVNDEFFYDSIEGFTYESGYEYTIKVRVTDVENPPMDASSKKYTLIEVVSREAVSLDGTVNCPEERSQIVTREYLPVLASDEMIYSNWREACANEEVMWYYPFDHEKSQEAVNPVHEQSFTTCPDERPEMCTADYRPTCALVDTGIRCITEPCDSTGVQEFSNACTACANKDTIGHYDVSCDAMRWALCDTDFNTGFDYRQLAKDAGYVCVDSCPVGTDEYVTQIGLPMCIYAYDEVTINEWSVCDKSSDTCNCVRAYETTDGTQIDDSEYRCVPEHYADRLLFRGGVDRLDENGQASVMIA